MKKWRKIPRKPDAAFKAGLTPPIYDGVSVYLYADSAVKSRDSGEFVPKSRHAGGVFFRCAQKEGETRRERNCGGYGMRLRRRGGAVLRRARYALSVNSVGEGLAPHSPEGHGMCL